MVGPLTDDERYSFDLQGFLVRRGVLAPAELAALHEAIDGLGLAPPGETIQSQRFSDHLPRAAAFQHLIDHPAVLDIVVELCGVHVRLDHTYGIVMAPGTSGLGLHGGATPFDPAQYYLVRDGKIRCGLVAVQWALVDHPAGGGGFCGVPGSHKAGFARPERPDPRLAVEVPLAAGDLVVFTEALTHGTLTWRGPGSGARCSTSIPGELDVGGGPAVAGGAARAAHRTATAAAATTVGRVPPTGHLT